MKRPENWLGLRDLGQIRHGAFRHDSFLLAFGRLCASLQERSATYITQYRSELYRRGGLVRLPRTMLLPSERKALAAWLKRILAQTGLRPMEIAQAIGDSSTARLNRYRRAKAIPTKEALRKLARLSGVSFALACFRAGYFDELIDAISEMARYGIETRDAIYTHAAFMAAFTCFPHQGDVPEERRKEGLSFANAALSTWDEVAGELPIKSIKRIKLPEPLKAVVRVLRDKGISISVEEATRWHRPARLGHPS